MKSFSALRSLLLSAAVLFASALSPACCWAWSLAPQPVEGILVLRNGNILRGKVQKQGEQYLVHIPNGKLQVRASQVERFSQNLEEAYQHRRKARGGTSADSHLELAGWCLRHDLFDHCQSEIKDAHATDPDHPRLALLQRQLKNARQLAAREKEQLAKANAPVEPVEPLDPEKLEKAPQWARALFVRQIQPLVVHSCAAGGCHQTDSKTDFQLNRLALDGAGHPEATLRNLAATLEQIDWQAADQSALLRRAKKAHGSANASTPLPAHKHQVLQGWIEQLAEAHHKANELKLLPPVLELAALPASEGLILNPPQLTTSEPKSSEPSQVRQASFVPADPFDPSTFNRRYATTKPAEAPAEPTVPHVLVPSEPEVIPE